MLKALAALAAIAASVALPAGAQECYRVDPSAGRVSYEVKQAGSPFRGSFRRFGGEICVSAGRATRIDVWLEPASVESGLPEVDAALKGRDFFAATQYPRVTYTSERADMRGDTQLAHGTLQMKGKRRGFDVAFQLQPQGAGYLVSGTLTLRRLDFGVGIGEWTNTDWLSDEVRVDFRAPLSRK